jgi:hypothetical protein
MAAGWKFIVITPPIGGKGASKECVIVSIPDREAAEERLRAVYQNSEIHDVGESSQDFLDWLDIEPGKIFRVTRAEV